MTIRKILVPFDDSAAARAALGLALQLGRGFAAHVEALHVRIDPRTAIPVVGEGVSAAVTEELFELADAEGRAETDRAHAAFAAAIDAAKVPLREEPSVHGPTAMWAEEVGDAESVIAARGRLCDLLVVGGPGGSGSESAREAVLHAALFASGHPVLVAPAEPPKVVGHHVAVAWNGTTEAARAVTAALPLLEGADRVVVYEVDEGGRPGNAGALAEYLAWHGVSATCRNLDSREGSVGAALLEATAKNDLLVMGAYSHSRLRQLILGSVTHYVFERATIPLFLAH